MFWFALLSLLALCSQGACAQDYAREKRWSDDILATLMVGDAVWLTQKNGHRFLALYAHPGRPRAALIVAHGRGWSPDYELYGKLRTKLAEAGYATLAIQLPVLDGTAKLVDYIATYPDARERFRLATDFLAAQGYSEIAIVSHSLGATMANQYLIHEADPRIRAWAFISIINGLEEMYRIKVPVLDVFGSRDWDVTRWGADERRAQIMKIAGSGQVVVPEATHFYEGHEEQLLRALTDFLGRALH